MYGIVHHTSHHNFSVSAYKKQNSTRQNYNKKPFIFPDRYRRYCSSLVFKINTSISPLLCFNHDTETIETSHDAVVALREPPKLKLITIQDTRVKI
jgi:hypothetical protein